MGSGLVQLAFHLVVHQPKSMGICHGRPWSRAAIDSELARKIICRAGFASSLYRIGCGGLAQRARRVVAVANRTENTRCSFFRKCCACVCMGGCIKKAHASKFPNTRRIRCFMGHARNLADDVSGACMLALFDGGKFSFNFHLFPKASIHSCMYVCALFYNVDRRIFSVALV